MQQLMKRVQAVIARRADMAQCSLELGGVVEWRGLADRIGGHGGGGDDVHSTISVPSAGICQPARSSWLRSAEAESSAGFELLICRNIFLSISRPASCSMAPLFPDIAICPMACPVLLARPDAINSSSRQTVPSKNTSAAPARRALRSSVTSAQAATTKKYLPEVLSRMRRPRVSPVPLLPPGCALPSRYQAPLPGTVKGRTSMPLGEPSCRGGSNAVSISISWRLTFFSF